MIDGFRYSYTGVVDINLLVDAGIVTALAVIALAIAVILTKRGVNLRV
jgi:hypothetical protein